MFEKSLYDLIRGMRNHKGNEREYIQGCLKECRAEIRTQDLDLKATALLKLVYLEQFGHDMSWASFHVLEVMASPKYHQKRVGYLGAVQSFRPETEVLMLATNLLKKDLTSAATTTIALPIVALPHVITPSLALSTLSDLIPRLSHSHPVIRKKTIVTLYRLALVYPEALRAAWPKIKEKLMDATEDPSVTAAIVNVVCELGWRRPHDFLPLAPRLFELLVDSGNNWMAIKLIKLFATLTPLEPRLARKLLPPLTEIIRTTPAMSLLYECINGIIQGGILGSGEDEAGREEIASLCVSKLRSMIMVDGDPNLKYVALLAFNKIVVTHPWLVAQQEDVILECIDSTDISIRIKALDLVQGMVSSDNLVSIVGRLMRQLKRSTAEKDRNAAIDPTELDSDEESLERRIDSDQRTEEREAPLPDDYRIDVIYRILGMCSASNYSNLSDFVWYIDILTQLVRMAPLPRSRPEMDAMSSSSRYDVDDVSEQIGNELRSVAVKVQAMRPTCVLASGRIIGQLNDDVPVGHAVTSGSLKPVAWIVGEYASHLASGEDQLGDLLRLTPRIRDPETVASFLQALTKIFSFVAANDRSLWTAERKSKISLLMARIIHTLEPLVMHPNLEVQERAVEYSELLKLTAEAVSGQEVVVDGVQQDAPLLLTQAIPSLFSGWELNSVAPAAQKSVPLPDGLDLDEPINSNLHSLLANAGSVSLPDDEVHGFEMYYHQRPPPISLGSVPAVKRLVDERDGRQEVASSYQQPAEDSYLDADILARRKAERQERYRDDPFYIGGSDSRPRSTTPIHNILQSSNGPDLDVDSIPIMELDLDKLSAHVSGSVPARKSSPLRPQLRQKITVAADETLAGGSSTTPRNYDSENNSDGVVKSRIRQGKQSVLLGVDSTNLQSLNLEDDPEGSGFDFEAKQREDAEMARAMREVERLRLEMQRANERVQVAQGVDAEGTVVKKKAKKKAAVPSPAEDGTGASKAVKKKKKKKLKADEDGGGARGGDTGTAIGETAEDANGASSTTTAVKPKQKKRARTAEIQDLG